MFLYCYVECINVALTNTVRLKISKETIFLFFFYIFEFIKKILDHCKKNTKHINFKSIIPSWPCFSFYRFIYGPLSPHTMTVILGERHRACVLLEVITIFSFIVLAVMSLKQSWGLILLADMTSHKTCFEYLSKDVPLDQEDVLIFCVFLWIWKPLKIVQVSRPVTSHFRVSAKCLKLDVAHTASAFMPRLSLD